MPFRLHCCSGSECWRTTLPSRADMGMCLSPDATRLAVPAGDGRLYCLCTADGAVQCDLDCGADVRGPPVTDPVRGLWWLVTHLRELLVIDPHAVVVVDR